MLKFKMCTINYIHKNMIYYKYSISSLIKSKRKHHYIFFINITLKLNYLHYYDLIKLCTKNFKKRKKFILRRNYQNAFNQLNCNFFLL